MEGNGLFHKIGKIPQHIVYAVALLLIGLAFVGSYSYFRYKEFDIKEREKFNEQLNMMTKEREREINKQLRDSCFTEADDKYWSYVKLNGVKKGEGENATYSMPRFKWEYIEKRRREDKELCMKQYPIS